MLKGMFNLMIIASGQARRGIFSWRMACVGLWKHKALHRMNKEVSWSTYQIIETIQGGWSSVAIQLMTKTILGEA